MSRQSLPGPLTDPFSYAVHSLAIGIEPSVVEGRLLQLFPGVGPVGASATVAQALGARQSAASLGAVLSGETPAYLAPPNIPGVPSGQTQIDVRFDINDPRTGRTRTIIVRDVITGPLDANAIEAVAARWVQEYAAQYGLRTTPVPLGLRVTAVAQGPQA